jgi:hypothetical protein
MQPYAPHANVYLPYACFPMSMLIRPPLLATITLAHSHAQHLPRVFPTVLSFALVVLPTFNISFLFLLSCHVCWGRNLWHMTLFFGNLFFLCSQEQQEWWGPRGVDSSYHVLPTVSVERGILWCISIYIRGMYSFTLACVRLNKLLRVLKEDRCTKRGPKV